MILSTELGFCCWTVCEIRDDEWANFSGDEFFNFLCSHSLKLLSEWKNNLNIKFSFILIIILPTPPSTTDWLLFGSFYTYSSLSITSLIWIPNVTNNWKSSFIALRFPLHSRIHPKYIRRIQSCEVWEHHKKKMRKYEKCDS